MKKVFLTMTLLGGVVIGSTPSYASSTEDSNSIAGGGYEILENNILKPIGIQPRVPAGGGDFYCWVSGFQVYARYYHGYSTHSATARNGWGGQVRNVQPAGIQAYAVANATLHGNTGWWNVY
ncbi:lactococcin 972 family bacteriocin [Enterococcus sp. CSURQ0835]|uniref:lactococcin 972 family bacteriocin n=1 Tax=Enterococcus sp. CSURQ0835 TaxID=2681394 RepID=UPI001357C99B|nr:lactococcin 972 family bacteriocin [Enterococcus sp. CSURQ0835]